MRFPGRIGCGSAASCTEPRAARKKKCNLEMQSCFLLDSMTSHLGTYWSVPTSDGTSFSILLRLV